MRKKPGKPTLAVVTSTAPDPAAPPSDLGATGADLWRKITTEYDISDSGGREILRQVCASADRAAECAAIIDHDGPVVRGQYGPRDHPLLRHELAARAFVTRG